MARSKGENEMKESKIFKDCWPGLKTVYDTPHECGVCMEHIGKDWLFCPYCGNELYEEEETAELKPCPFCGGEKIESSEYGPAVLHDVGYLGKEYFVSCECCGAQVQSHKSMEDAVKLWNQRS